MPLAIVDVAAEVAVFLALVERMNLHDLPLVARRDGDLLLMHLAGGIGDPDPQAIDRGAEHGKLQRVGWDGGGETPLGTDVEAARGKVTVHRQRPLTLVDLIGRKL